MLMSWLLKISSSLRMVCLMMSEHLLRTQVSWDELRGIVKSQAWNTQAMAACYNLLEVERIDGRGPIPIREKESKARHKLPTGRCDLKSVASCCGGEAEM